MRKREKKRKEKKRKNTPTETGPHPQSHAKDLIVDRVRGNPSLRPFNNRPPEEVGSRRHAADRIRFGAVATHTDGSMEPRRCLMGAMVLGVEDPFGAVPCHSGRPDVTGCPCPTAAVGKPAAMLMRSVPSSLIANALLSCLLEWVVAQQATPNDTKDTHSLAKDRHDTLGAWKRTLGCCRKTHCGADVVSNPGGQTAQVCAFKRLQGMIVLDRKCVYLS